MSTGEPGTDPFWARVRDLFHECEPLPPAARAALLDRECDDAKVRAEVEALLEANDGAGAFLGSSVWKLIDADDGRRLVGTPVGRYRLERQLGHGGMGTVFLAQRDDDFAQRVAIKLIRGGSVGDAIVRRFRQERQILAALEHPGIARLLDGGTTSDGLPYLVMEYVDGIPIDVYCREHACSTNEKLRLFLQLCDAVQYAHRSLVIHRDIKPANVLVTADGTAKLLDFGIAKLTSEELPNDAPVTRLMTPDYASPEQIAGRPVTTASDVYSLGVLLFELLTGQRPFNSVQRTGDTEAPRASSISGARGLRGDLDRILMVALEPDEQQRYGSVEKFADDIRRHLGGHPVSARGASLSYRTAKFVRRNRLVVAAGALALAVMVVAFVAVLQQKRIAERRFEQVRALARSVVFDLHDAIARLPGSTPARELLVRNALVYLDTLAAEATDNRPLQMELAAAYQRVGDVQGMPYQPNLGDTRGAEASYRKALAIAGDVLARDPGDAAAASLLADLHDRTGWLEQRALRFGRALAQHQEARALREPLRGRNAAGDLALARTWVAIADSLYQGPELRMKDAGRPVTARAAYERAVSILDRVPANGPHRKDRLTEIGRVHQRLGGYFTGALEHDPRQALAHHQAALQALEERASIDAADAVARRNFVDQLVMLATLQNSVGDANGALHGTSRALPVLRELAAADTNNVEALSDLAFCDEQRGRALVALRRFDEAAEAYGEALTVRKRLVAADPANAEGRAGLAALEGLIKDMEAARGAARAAAR